MNILFVCSEVYPLNKTGGLGDVAYGLPHALQKSAARVHLLIPAYRDLIAQLENVHLLAKLDVSGEGRLHSVRLLKATHPDIEFDLYLVDCQPLYDRPGNPYQQANGEDWPDNAERFSVFSRVAVQLAIDSLGLDWKPDVVHCHDWQSGLVAALLSLEANAPKSVFTIHNLAYGGRFSAESYARLQLPEQLWSIAGLEFYGEFSMLKAGIVYADLVTTVSPTYAREILTPEFGHGMEGILQQHQYKLIGILNGIDKKHWNPATDQHLPKNYSSDNVTEGKKICKQALLRLFGLEANAHLLTHPLFGLVGRLVEQKGIDLILAIIANLIEQTEACFVFLGTGDPQFERQLEEMSARYPTRVKVRIGFSEKVAHLIEAGADIFLMPSRFEPCGLNQMYSLHYGTPPIVYNTGGLADTIINTGHDTLDQGTANGFVFNNPDAESLLKVVNEALGYFYDKPNWLRIMKNGMALKLSWDNRARDYLTCYQP